MATTKTLSEKPQRRLITTIAADAPDRTDTLKNILILLQAHYEKLLHLEYEKSKAILIRDSILIQNLCETQTVQMTELEEIEKEKDSFLAQWNMQSLSVSQIIDNLEISEKEKADLEHKRKYLETLISDLEGRSRTNTVMMNDFSEVYRLSIAGITGESTLSYNKRGEKVQTRERQLVDMTA